MSLDQLQITRIAVSGENRIEVRASGGLAGRGEGAWCERVLRARPGLVIGRSPFEVEAIFEELSGLGGETPGGLDLALWDLAGKALGRPARAILGKIYREQVAVCGSREFPLLESIPGGGTPRFGLRLTLGSAEEVLAAAEDLRDRPLEFWESPLPHADLEGYRRLKRELALPVAVGPAVSLDTLVRDYIQTGLADLVLQDVAAIGLTGFRRLQYLCWLFRARLAPCCAATPLGTAAALQAAAGIPPATNALAPPPVFLVAPGAPAKLTVPAGPGLGVTETPGEPRVVLD